MKKKYLIVALIDIVLIVVGIILINKHNPKEVEKRKEVYLVNYTASYSTYDILKSVDDYEIVRSLMDLKVILERAKNNNYDNRYDNTFFEENALLVIQGLMDSNIYNTEFKMFRAYIDAYTATPLANSEEEFTFDLYLIPVEKTLTHVELNVSSYPGILY